jgi:drug/metabolite transporter (DMT)-like permease
LCGLNTVIAYGSFSEALNHWEASRISATFTIVPLLTMGFVYLLSFYPIVEVATEPMDFWVIVGAILVVIGAALASLARSKQGK